MSEPVDIVRMREALKGHARFRELPEGSKVKLFEGLGKIREWLGHDIEAEDFSNPKRLRRDRESLINPLKRILHVLYAHREISIDLVDGLLRDDWAESGKIDSAASAAELDAFRRTARRLLTIAERAEPSRRLTILQDRHGRISVADPPSDFIERYKPRVGPPIVIGFKPGLSQRKKMEFAMVHELLAEVFVGLSKAEASELAAAITVYTRADERKNGKPVTPYAIKKQRQRQRRRTGTNMGADFR